MPKYEVMQDFRGSPDGRFVVSYTRGEQVDLTDTLAEVALREEWVRIIPTIPQEPERPKRGRPSKKDQTEG